MELRDGRTALFWEDRWCNGYRLQELAPGIYAKVPKRGGCTRTVEEAMLHASWARDVGPNLNEDELGQFKQLWAQVEGVNLETHRPDQLVWSWEKNGQFSVRSAYAARFAT